MITWLPMLAVHRIALAAVHAGVAPLIPAVPFLADGTPASGSDVLGAAAQTVLGFGVLGVVALALAWITYKGSFVPERRVDALIMAGRADLLRENERLITEITRLQAELAKTQDQRDAALKFGSDQLAPLLFQFTAATTSLLPILQDLTRGPGDTPASRRRGRELP
jgi:hypothetical protein